MQISPFIADPLGVDILLATREYGSTATGLCALDHTGTRRKVENRFGTIELFRRRQDAFFRRSPTATFKIARPGRTSSRYGVRTFLEPRE